MDVTRETLVFPEPGRPDHRSRAARCKRQDRAPRAATAPPARSGTRIITSIRCSAGSGRCSILPAWKAARLDIAWTSELDPAWLDDELSFLLSPEAALFANLPAQAACAADCAAASAGLPLRIRLFWCAGCQGGMYPLTGNVAAHVGGVQASLLAGPAPGLPAASGRASPGAPRDPPRSADATRCR